MRQFIKACRFWRLGTPASCQRLRLFLADGRGTVWVNKVLLAIAIHFSAPVFAQPWIQTSAPITNWSSVACSADGTKLVATVDGGGIYTSPDFGIAWALTSAPTNYWTSVASSADGTKLAAVGWGNVSICTSSDSGATWTTATNVPHSLWK